MSEQHPIVNQLQPSAAQQRALQSQGRDVVVTAGAGAGKTRTLVARYLSLLARRWPLRSLIAITFTRKAAREMRSRVREEVQRYTNTADLSSEEQAYWQNLTTGLDAARIGTIHSLCEEILRGHPAEARLDPRFQIVDEGQINLLQAQAVSEALSKAADNVDIVPLFLLLGEFNLQRILRSLLQQRLDAAQAFSALPQDLPPDAILHHWEGNLAIIRRNALDNLLTIPPWQEAISTLRDNQALDADDRAEIQRAKALAAAELLKNTGAVGKALTGLFKINLVGGRSKAWPGGKAQLTEVKGALRTLRELCKDHAEALTLEINDLDQALAQHMRALETVHRLSCARYAALKRQRNALDFDDLEQGALDLLKTERTVRQRWQSEIRALLVDEFQDTNARQRDLIALINGDAQKRFIVGDAKQSIYRFRGADVSVFRKERVEIEHTGGALHDLTTSYRAHRDLIAGINALMTPVLGTSDDPARPWVEPFASLTHDRTSPAAGLTAPFIEFHLSVGSKSEGAGETAAKALTQRLIALVNQGISIGQGANLRPLNYGDIAILCRASTSFATYEDALDRADVPFLTVAGRGFYQRPEVRDVLNALHAIANPSDDLPLVGLLRSPACGLSDAALYALIQANQKAAAGPLWAFLKNRDYAFLGEASSQISHAQLLIAGLHEQIGRVPVADILKAFLDETDYRAALNLTNQARGTRNVNKLLADAQGSGIISVSEFLAYVDNLRESGTREGEASPVGSGAVQIMSVHAAKGLEFPVVVIGDAGYRVGSRAHLLLDQRFGVLPQISDKVPEGNRGRQKTRRPAVYTAAQLMENDQATAESTRLLYVAATRAQEMLLFSGNVRLRKKGLTASGWLKWLFDENVLDLIGAQPTYNPEGNAVQELSLSLDGQSIGCALYEPHCAFTARATQSAAPSASVLPPTLPMLDPVSQRTVNVDTTPPAHRDPPPRVWRVVPEQDGHHAPSWVVGSLVHSALENWHFPEPQGEGNRVAFDAWVEAGARGYGITDADQLEDAARRTVTMLRRFQASDLYKMMVDAPQRLHEVPYTLMAEDGQLENGTIDALFQAETGWTLVEFKVDYVKNDQALEVLFNESDYIAQVQRYLDAAERLLGKHPQPILCFLNFDRAVHTITDRW